VRILLVGNSVRPVGGAEAMLHRTAGLLRAAGHDVRLLSLAGDLPANRLTAVWNRAAAADTRRLLATWRPDVADVHYVYEGLSLSVVDALQRAGVPVVLTLHDYRPVCPNYRLFRAGRPCDRCLSPARRPVEVARLRCLEGPRLRSVAAAAEVLPARRVYDRVARFVAPSRYLAGVLRAGGLPDRVTVLPNPVDRLPPRPAPPAEPRFAYVGRLTGEKGLAVLLAAARTGLRVDVYGDGRQEAELRATAPPTVTLHGRLAPADVPAALHRATAAVLPALWPENCPLSVLEAAACAVPTVASAVGGLPELIGPDTGVLVPPGDPAALAAALAGLTPARSAALGAAARARVLAEHSPESYATRLLEVLATPGP
jgi:glycosyltransferase involved in cell wall biosynthesis